MLTDLLHLFAQNPLHPAYAAPEHRLDRVPEPLDWVAFDGGIVRVGHEGDGFAFDCEAPAHDALPAPYALADRPVTNAEWRSEEHTSELQSLMRISYAVFCLKK